MSGIASEDLEVALVPNKTVHKARSFGPNSFRVTDSNFEGGVWDVGPIKVDIN